MDGSSEQISEMEEGMRHQYWEIKLIGLGKNKNINKSFVAGKCTL